VELLPLLPQLRGADGGKLMYDELIKALRCCGSEDRCKGCPRENAKTKCYDDICIEAADAIEELSAYVRQIEGLRKDGYYLQKTKMMTYGQARMTMPLPEPSKEE
jgi:hypothetical protein